MSKRSILRIAIIFSSILLVYAVGMCVTNDYELNFKNFLVGLLVSITITIAAFVFSYLADVVLTKLPKELVEEDIELVPDVPQKTEEELEEQISIENLVLPMSDDEFYLFLSKGRYGDDKPEKGAILHLLEQIKDDPRCESKEKTIYKKLQEIK